MKLTIKISKKLIQNGMFLLLIACSSTNQGNVQTDINLVTKLSNNTTEPIMPLLSTLTTPKRVSIPPIQIIYPTMNPPQYQTYLDSLLASDCVLPCYLGFLPGSTSFLEGNTFIENLGGIKHRVNPHDEDVEKYSYSLNFDGSDGLAQYHIYLTVIDGVVQRLEVVHNGFSAPTNYEYWYRFSLRESLKQLGIPDEIFIHINPYSVAYGIGILLIYKEIGVVIDISGIGEDGSICPKFEMDYTTSIILLLTNPNSPLGLFEEDQATPYNSGTEIWDQIVNVLGISEQQFYNQILSDPDVCFDPIEVEQ